MNAQPPSRGSPAAVVRGPSAQLKALYRMGQTVTSSLDLETVFQTVLAQIAGVVHCTGSSILLPGDGDLVFAAAQGEGSEILINQHVPLEDSIAGIVFQTGKAVVVSDAVTSRRVFRLSGQSGRVVVGSLLAVPLTLGDQILGVMEAVHTSQHQFSNQDLQLLETAASWASIAISNARQHADLEKRIEERHQIESARQSAEAASHAKSEFLANMSHEIRTPMNAILGFSHLAIQSETNPRQRDYLSKIQSSAYALLHILDDILNYSKLETGRLEIEAAPFRLDQMLDDLFAHLLPAAKEKGLSLQLNLATNVPVALIADARRLRDVLENLLENGIKFTERGEVALAVELVQYQEKLATLRFIISDTGIGMDKTQLSRLFKPFVQADGSTTRKYGGTGLGLAICKQLLDRMGGSIEAQSKPGAGSQFIVTLALVLEPEPPRYQIMPAIPGKLRILVADSDPAACMLFENILRSMKFAVSLLDSELAVQHELERAIQAGEQPYDLLVIDWKAPGNQQPEFIQVIKNNRRLPQPPAIIVTTAHSSSELPQLARQLQVDGFLVKPVTSSLLLDTIQDIFWQRSSKPAAVPQPIGDEAGECFKLEGKRVLLVEDNEINRQIARELLEQVGVLVTEVENGRQAVEMIADGALQFNAILMDVAMPVMNGYEATRRIRLDPLGQDIPIIAMTANAMLEDREKCREAGMDDHIAKPVDTQELLNVLSTWLTPLPEPPCNPTEPAEQSNGPSEITQSSQAIRDGLSLQDYKPLMDELRSLMEAHDTDALNALEIIQEQLQHTILDEHLAVLRTLLLRYDFHDAIEYMDRLFGNEVIK